MRRWILLRLEAPLMSFGGVAIDQRGPTDDFPTASQLVGLFANALGWRRAHREAHQRLQNRLIYGARRDREPHIGVLTDVQNAKLEKNDAGWTTLGVPEGRRGASYDGPHRRQRDYHPDALLLVAATLTEAEGTLGVDTIAEALVHPARPLFIGRKPCLPSAPIFVGFIDAATARAALEAAPRLDLSHSGDLRAVWPRSECDGRDFSRSVSRSDRRNWRSGLHGGAQVFHEGFVSPKRQSLPERRL